ncbi:MAG: hypothetical protein GY727_01845, partial [Gammaproteobacteria bacterium]|nr:hypothetical protein [Gammaproteobacteria bacterium]
MSERTLKPDSSCVDVALEIPMRRVYTYLYRGIKPAPGIRVKVPFGKRKLVGVVVATHHQPPENVKLREVEAVLDAAPLFSSRLMQLLAWTAAYYHQPLGEVWRTAMPAVLRKGLAETHGLLE